MRENNHQITRRQVMIGAAGLAFAIAYDGTHPALAAQMASSETGAKAINPWVSIAPDGRIFIMSPAAEMGQGSRTSLPRIVADELDADWDEVQIVPAPPIDSLYANPGFGMLYTAGSNAVTSYFTPLRKFGRQVRKVLLDNAARKWGVPASELDTEPSVVIHAASGRRMSYGEIAEFAVVPAK